MHHALPAELFVPP
uniref:Uncharacterized protein n=1 Tax=Anguilla anguilla TaxID=7936 RepID=A0A0E9PAZ8_ANGAN